MSNPELTVIVPTKNSAGTIQECLRSILSQDFSNIEVVVVDNYSEDDTREVSQGLGVRVVLAGPERSAQRNVGLAEARASSVLFIDSDMVLEPGVCREVWQHLKNPLQMVTVTIPEMSFGATSWARVRAFERKLILGNASVEAPRGFRTLELRAIGGWSEDQVAGEDWELADRFAGRGAITSRTTSQIWHDEGNLNLRKSFVKKRYYAQDLAKMLSQSSHRSSGLLSRFLGRRQAGMLIRHPIKAIQLSLLKAVELSGFAIGIRFPPNGNGKLYGER